MCLQICCCGLVKNDQRTKINPTTNKKLWHALQSWFSHVYVQNIPVCSDGNSVSFVRVRWFDSAHQYELTLLDFTDANQTCPLVSSLSQVQKIIAKCMIKPGQIHIALLKHTHLLTFVLALCFHGYRGWKVVDEGWGQSHCHPFRVRLVTCGPAFERLAFTRALLAGALINVLTNTKANKAHTWECTYT